MRRTKARVAKDQRLKEDASGKLLVPSRAVCLFLFISDRSNGVTTI
jgi:hypothetical protein